MSSAFKIHSCPHSISWESLTPSVRAQLWLHRYTIWVMVGVGITNRGCVSKWLYIYICIFKNLTALLLKLSTTLFLQGNVAFIPVFLRKLPHSWDKAEISKAFLLGIPQEFLFLPSASGWRKGICQYSLVLCSIGTFLCMFNSGTRKLWGFFTKKHKYLKLCGIFYCNRCLLFVIGCKWLGCHFIRHLERCCGLA